MTALRYATHDVPRSQSFAYWRELICDVFINLDCSADSQSEFNGSIQSTSLAGIEVSQMRAQAMRLERTRLHASRAHDDHFLIVLQDEGLLRAHQGDHECVLHPGDLAVFDGARPYVANFVNRFGHTVIKAPRRLMRERYGPLESCTGLRIAGDRGLGLVASRIVASLPTAADGVDSAAEDRLASIALDVIAAAVTQNTTTGVRPVSVTQAVRLVQAKDYIEMNLGDPELAPSRIAAALKVSPRYLSELFSAEDTTVMRHVLARRLARCQKLLEDPRHAGRSISSVAFGLGFNSMPHFSRCFREQFGLSPREFRAAALRP